MKRSLIAFVLVCLLAPLHAVAQSSGIPSDLDKLEAQIAALEAVAKDATASARVREINQQLLQKRRAELASRLQNEIASLKNYLSAISFLTTEEKKQITDDIESMEHRLNHAAKTAPGTSGGSTAVDTSSPGTQPPAGAASNIQPRTTLAGDAPATNVSDTHSPNRPSDDSAGLVKITGRVLTLPNPGEDAATYGLPGIKVTIFDKDNGEVGGGSTESDGKFTAWVRTFQQGTTTDTTKPPTTGPGANTGTTNRPTKSTDAGTGAGTGTGTGTDTAKPPCADTTKSPTTSPDTSKPSFTYKLEASGKGYRTLVRNDLQISGCAFKLPDIYLDKVREGTGELVRTIIGFEQAGGASTNSIQNFFSDFYITTPFPISFRARTPLDSSGPRLGPSTRIWSDIRFASAPKLQTGTLSEFVGGFIQNFASTPVSEVARAFEFLAGLEFRLPGRSHKFPSIGTETKQRFTINIIASGGGVSSLQVASSPQQNTIFLVPQRGTQADALSQAVGRRIEKPYVAFLAEDRTRFFREFYAGLRFKTYYYDKYGNPLDRFPATLDLSYGLNESVTGGRLRGGMFRLEGFYALPNTYTRFLYLFGTALLRPVRAKSGIPLALDTAPSGITLTDPKVAIIPVGQIDRDYYRFGVGVDAIELFKFLGNPSDKPKNSSK